MLTNMTSQEVHNDKVKLDERDRDVSEPRSIEGRSTVDVKTGELVWEPEQVSDMCSGIASMKVDSAKRVGLFGHLCCRIFSTHQMSKRQTAAGMDQTRVQYCCTLYSSVVYGVFHDDIQQ